ncbi:MAG: sodium-dependent transporter [Bacteroidales bacterium]|nr:sodium-dependent transporter [Bacteroidales bacterium]
MSKRDSFGSKFGIIAAAAGSAIGLGNIWRFPYVVGENGGGAFLIIYLFFIIAIGLPVMLSEFTIGRKAQLNPVGAFKKIAPGTSWYFVGLMGVGAAFMILAFYSTIAGWTLEYVYNAITNAFADKTPTQLSDMFNSFKSGTFRPVLWQLVFMGLTAWIVIAGVQKGIEKSAKILMPLLLVLILILVVRSVTLNGAKEGLTFLFKPDFSKINAGVILKALGQAAFSLSIGMGTLITYGSYINKDNNLAKTAFQVSAADTIIAILAGVAIFPAVFAFNLQPDAGEGLVFIVLPNIFQQMTGGAVFAVLFFVLLTVAALTSSISVLEVVVAYFVEQLKMTRKKATIIASISISIIGIFCSLSWGVFKDLTVFNLNIFGILEYIAANVLLPLGALFIVIFVAWYMKRKITKNEITSQGMHRMKLFNIFMIIIKFIAPIAIALVFLNGIGILKL